MLKHSFAKAGVAAVLAASLLAPASAATLTPLFVTGGTAAAFAYYDLANHGLFPNSMSGLTCASTADCVVEQLYAATGTGGAQASFLAHAVAGTVGSGEPPYNDGTNLPGVWSPTPTGDIDYAAGDAPLSVAQLSSYSSSLQATYGAADVVPTMSIPIGIAYNPTGTGLPSGTALNLSMKSLCGIYEGTITFWDDASIMSDNPGVTFNHVALTPVARLDGSGTTFIFSNALNQACPTINGKTWAQADGGVGIGGSSSAAPVWPSDVVLQKGSGAVSSTVLATSGSVGYLSTNYVQPFAPAGPLAANVQNKAGNFEAPTVANAKAALSGPFLKTGPTGTGMDGTVTQYPAPVTNQILYLAKPTSTSAYPIVGFTYAYFYQCSDAKSTTSALVGSTHSFFKNYILAPETSGLTAADQIIEADGLVELSNIVKGNTKKLIATNAATKIVNGPVAGVCTVVAH